MAHAGELTNRELADRYGLRLDGQRRVRLNQASLVTSTFRDRAYHHELSDDGWAWCERGLTAGHPAGSDTGTKALYAVLAALQRHLAASDLKLAQVVSPAVAVVERSAQGTEDRIRAAYTKLAERPGDWVRLVDLRQELPDAPRTEVDHALLRLERRPGVQVVADPDGHGLTDADRAASVRIDGSDRHLLLVDG
jgi:hypothetical protein